MAKLNENLGVDAKWLKEKRRIYDQIRELKKEQAYYKKRTRKKKV